MTGNNVSLTADTARRVCHVRLECTDENPEERTGFKHPDLRSHVREHRTELLSAALTILRAWFAAGKPDMDLKPWGSFEGWSIVLRNAVTWAGLFDPGITRQELRERGDNETTMLQGLLAGWEEIGKAVGVGVGVTAAQVLDMIERYPDNYPTLRNTILDPNQACYPVLCGDDSEVAIGA